MKQISWKIMAVFISVTLTSLTLAGCGKNTMGPAVPNAGAQQVSSANQDAAEVVPLLAGGGADAACAKGGWTQNHYRDHLLKFTPWYLTQLCRQIVVKWFGDPAISKTITSITEARLFNIIVFRCGVGPLLVLKSLKILSKTWFPGLNTNPRKCTPEITLFPFQWNPYQGFYGGMLSGWVNDGAYHLDARTAEQDYVIVEAKSYITDILKNEGPIYSMQWSYMYAPFDPAKDVPQIMKFRLTNAYWDKRLVIDNARIDDNNERIVVSELWASTETKAARCKIISQNSDLLNMDLQFGDDGAGGGTVDIQTWTGAVTHYEFTVLANGHGYYTKNSGRKLWF